VEGVVMMASPCLKAFLCRPPSAICAEIPQPVKPWEGVKKASEFRTRTMQDTAFGAMLGGRKISETVSI
jgi:hypothetical protein